MKIRALVHSKNHYFLECLSNYVMESAGVEFEFYFFTDGDAADDFLKTQRVELAVADELFLSERDAFRLHADLYFQQDKG